MRLLWLALVVAAMAVAAPHLLARRIPAPPGTADAVVVLAGGENRVAAGYRAWRDGRGRSLYILGARRGVDLAQVLPGVAVPQDLERAGIHMEGWSENTLENALVAASIAAARGFRSMVLVTSDYHVARAYFTVRRFLPAGVTLYAAPVGSGWSGWRQGLRSARLFAVEGGKYWAYRVLLAFE